MNNYMKLEIPSRTTNEAFARAAVGAFATQLDLNIEELSDIKTAVSEAVTNSIIHGYDDSKGVVYIKCEIKCLENKHMIEICIEDKGKGIENIDVAMQPLYTTSPNDERSGMGFTVMQSFMDSLIVTSSPGDGTKIVMTKHIGADTTYD